MTPNQIAGAVIFAFVLGWFIGRFFLLRWYTRELKMMQDASAERLSGQPERCVVGGMHGAAYCHTHTCGELPQFKCGKCFHCKPSTWKEEGGQ